MQLRMCLTASKRWITWDIETFIFFLFKKYKVRKALGLINSGTQPHKVLFICLLCLVCWLCFFCIFLYNVVAPTVIMASKKNVQRQKITVSFSWYFKKSWADLPRSSPVSTPTPDISTLNSADVPSCVSARIVPYPFVNWSFWGKWLPGLN